MTHAHGGEKRQWWWAVVVVVTLSAIAAFFWTVERVADRRSTGVEAPSDIEGVDASANETTSPVADYVAFAGAAGDRQVQDQGTDQD